MKEHSMSATPVKPQPIFDGHNDVLLRLFKHDGADPVNAFLKGEARGHIDLPKTRAGGFAGGMFAIFVPSPSPTGGSNMDTVNAAMATGHYQVPLPPLLGLSDAQSATFAMVALLFRIEAASKGAVKVCRSVADIRHAQKSNALASVLHIEGAEAIDDNFNALEVLHKAGLRSLGPVWSRSNIYADGVPFRFPSGPDIGNGLTDAGKALIRACNDLKILIDLSHMNEKGFWDIEKLTDAPLVATHSNAHALCASSRNLTDKQLAAIKQSGGIVGVNFATSFLRQDGRRIAETPLDTVVDHLAYFIDKMGEDCVALGSDFDGAQMPEEIGTAAGLPNLVAAMRRRQFGETVIEKICFENWMRVLAETWGEDAEA
jgi:membrane dipeptidase